MVGKDLGHLGQHAGLIYHFDVQVVLALPILQDGRSRVQEGLVLKGHVPVFILMAGVDQIRNDGAGRGQVPRPAPVQHQIPHRVAMHKHSVKGAADRGQRMGIGDKGRVYPRLHLIAPLFADSQQLEGIAHLLAVGDVLFGHLGDALVIDHIDRQPGMEAHRPQDRELVHRVIPLHIAGGVRLGQAQLLRTLQHFFVA